MNEPLLKLRNLKKYYYVQRSFFSTKRIEIRAVDGVNLSLYPSTSVAVVGESGCGKTTLARLILKLTEPTSGEIQFGSGISNLGKDISIVFQNPYNSLSPLMRIEDIVYEPLLIHRRYGLKSDREDVLELLQLVKIDPESRFRLPREFSGGQRQRISIARALATQPKVIILDEPVSSLDVSIQAQILKLLKSLQEKFNLSLLYITHNLAIVKNFCDEVLVMYLGKVMEQADTQELFSSVMHPYTESLLLASREKKSKLKGDVPRFRQLAGCIFNTRCPYVKNKCFEIEPKLEEKGKGHFTACHFPIIK